MATAMWAWMVALAIGVCEGDAAAQTPPAGQASRSASIPPPRRFQPGDPALQPAPAASPPGPSEATSPPTALAIPDRAQDPTPVVASFSALLDTSLIPGRSIEPIDLANALRLAGARDIDIALARQRVNEAVADLDLACALWLPSLFIGPTWYRADGQVQTITGQVRSINRSSLFQVAEAYFDLQVASANLVGLLVLNPRIVIAPVEPAETIVRLIPDDAALDDLVVQGLRQRPELAGAQELVQATLLRVKQAKLRPFVPSLAVSYAGGGFGGGQGSFFGNFGARGDVAASLFWELQNLGFGDR
ncbi:MAG: hypothetical protein ACHRXM_33610, partial [Isosphaerales bacterium]